MMIQVRSSAGRAERRRIAVVLTVVSVCVPVCFLLEKPAVRAYAQTKSSMGTVERFRIQVLESESDFPIRGAAVCVVYWQKKAATEEKKEMEVKTDRNGFAEFPRVKADKLAVGVEVMGYRSCWRWVRANSSEELTCVRLERWAKSPK